MPVICPMQVTVCPPPPKKKQQATIEHHKPHRKHQLSKLSPISNEPSSHPESYAKQKKGVFQYADVRGEIHGFEAKRCLAALKLYPSELEWNW